VDTHFASQGSLKQLEISMAKEPTNGATKVKSGIKRTNKPRTFYMVYKGELHGEPAFAFDRDQLIETMLNDREVKVQKITLPTGTRRSRKGVEVQGEGHPSVTPTA
jgi:hypothetical protein